MNITNLWRVIRRAHEKMASKKSELFVCRIFFYCRSLACIHARAHCADINAFAACFQLNFVRVMWVQYLTSKMMTLIRVVYGALSSRLLTICHRFTSSLRHRFYRALSFLSFFSLCVGFFFSLLLCTVDWLQTGMWHKGKTMLEMKIRKDSKWN